MENTAALRFLILTSLCQVAFCYTGSPMVFMNKTWMEARAFCKNNNTDLMTITNQEEDDEADRLNGDAEAWIGLNSRCKDTWMWVGGGQAQFFNWRWENTTQELKPRCVVHTKNGWYKKRCDEKHYFLCFKNSLVLVKENKTWEEALEYCRARHKDLASLPSEAAMHQAMQTIRESQTSHVWTGLRYLSDSWLWVNGDALEYQAWKEKKMPVCPAWTQKCGVLSLDGSPGYWNSWNCMDKLNFICN